jgi:hypothetical protein
LPKAPVAEEVQVLRFFEEAPLEKAEMLFNIVKDKMRSRLNTGAAPAGAGRKTKERRAVASPTQTALTGTGTGNV